MSLKITKDDEDISLELNDGKKIIRFSLLKYKGEYELFACKNSHNVYNFVRLALSNNNDMETLKEFFELITNTLNINKVDYIPVLKDDTIEIIK